MNAKQDKTPEERLQSNEHRAHVEVEVLDAAAGAAAGAALGILGGPVGMAAGAVIGAATGALLGAQMERDEHEHAMHDKELDAISFDNARPKEKGADEEPDEPIEEPPTKVP